MSYDVAFLKFLLGKINKFSIVGGVVKKSGVGISCLASSCMAKGRAPLHACDAKRRVRWRIVPRLSSLRTGANGNSPVRQRT